MEEVTVKMRLDDKMIRTIVVDSFVTLLLCNLFLLPSVETLHEPSQVDEEKVRLSLKEEVTSQA